MWKKKEDADKIRGWQKKLTTSKAYYQDELDKMSDRENIYNGRRDMDKNPNVGKGISKEATNVRNIAFELIESQIDSNIPACKATPRDELDEGLAKTIEDVLRNEVDRLPMEYINDEQERTCPIQGGSYILVEWDNTQRTHSTIGELSLRLLHTRQVIPQAGVTDLQQCDYIFVLLPQTKDYIKRQYNVNVDSEEETDSDIRSATGNAQPADDIVTQNIAYYRNEDGGIGKFSWVNNVILEDLKDYQARKQKKCLKCDAVYPSIYEECPYCESKKSETVDQEYETIEESMLTSTGIEVPAMSPVQEEFIDLPPLPEEYMIGELPEEPTTEPTKIKYYKPNVFPIVLRKNVSIFGKTLGNSDIDFIRDQQNAINKLMTKVEEKLFKGGSWVTLPEGVNISTTDEELKIIRYKTPDQIAGIKTINVQPDIGNDMALIRENYEYARQTVGITDSFQGRQDRTATSGKAKEFAAAQSAGRLESKRRMKNAAYASLYEVMFKFLLAYADEERGYKTTDQAGDETYGKFSRYDFLKKDAAGEFYYNDEFLFSTDSSGGLANNREAMWQEARDNFSSGAFGDPGDIDTQIIYWKAMKKLHYPGAADILTALNTKKETMQEQVPPQAPLPPQIPEMPEMTGGLQNVM